MEYDGKKENLVPDIKYLRTGSRAGENPFDRYIGYINAKAYENKMKNIVRGIISNDFIIYNKDSIQFQQKCEKSLLERVFENQEIIIYKVTDQSRNMLSKTN